MKSKMKPDVWMPMYWADFLADTLHLGRAELGSYVLMIGAYWRRGGPLPDDDEALRNICRCQATDWARCKGTLRDLFQVESGEWRHKRIDREIEEATANKLANQARTAAATAARHRNVTDNVTTIVTSGVTFTPSPSPSPSPSPLSSPIDKASGPTKSTKLSKLQKEMADGLESTLGTEWTNDAGKWIGRVKSNPRKVDRVLAELIIAIREGRINTTPAAYAEDTWKRFA